MASRGRQAEPRRPAPRLYLVTPRDPVGLAHLMAQALAAADVAAILLRLPDAGQEQQINHVRALAPAVQGQGVALLLDGHPHLAASAGADGAHLDGVDALKCALAQLKPERIAGCGYLSQDDPRVHFGLGAASKIDRLTITWPSGIKQVVENPAVDRVIAVEEK